MRDVAGDEMAGRLVAWYRGRRRDWPWRRSSDAYAIWISEVMLQQTRIAVVIPYFERWMARFPGPVELAAAELDDVLGMWSGLGYYGRARNLHRGAAEIVARYGGRLPDDAAELRSLPGIGRYTAGAIASMAFGRREAVVDGNVARVLARVYAIDEDVSGSAVRRRLWEIAERLVPGDAPGDFNQGLMELGQEVCTPGMPRCEVCPLADLCAARAEGRAAELPITGKRKAAEEKPLLRGVAAWVERGGRVLLARRRPSGLFGGLWEVPQAQDRGRLKAFFSALGWRLELGARAIHRHRQELSHRRLSIDVYVGRIDGRPASREVGDAGSVYERLAWHSLATLGSLGVAASSRAILKRHREQDGWTTSAHSPSRSSKRATTRSSRG